MIENGMVKEHKRIAFFKKHSNGFKNRPVIISCIKAFFVRSHQNALDFSKNNSDELETLTREQKTRNGSIFGVGGRLNNFQRLRQHFSDLQNFADAKCMSEKYSGPILLAT